MELDVDGKGFEVDVVIEDVWRKGGELIVIEVHEWMEGRKNEEGVGRGNETRFLRLMKVVFWSDWIEFEWRSIVMWNGNVDWKGLKEGCKKGEVIESIRVNGNEIVGIQIAWEIEWEGVDMEWWLSVKVKISQTVESIEHARREGG